MQGPSEDAIRNRYTVTREVLFDSPVVWDTILAVVHKLETDDTLVANTIWCSGRQEWRKTIEKAGR